MLNLSNVEFALTISFLAGLASLLGALFVFAFKGLPLKRVALGLGFSAGIMVYLSFFELLPESIAILDNKYIVIFYFVIGAFVAYLLDILTHYFLDRDSKHDDNIILISKQSNKKISCSQIGDKKLMAAGVFVALAIGLHNLPEGVVTFTSALLNPYLGLTMALAIAIHNIPEGFCVALPIYCSTKSRWQGIFYAFIAGIAEPIGALLAWLLLMNYSSPPLMGGLLAGVSGIMFYVAIDELIPAAKKLGHGHLSILGVILGVIFMFAVISLMNLAK
ncbi:MAG: ZIP family metal transporter [Patescibacteria group bacterium]